MGLWSIFASPLLMSNDPRLVSNESRAILLNEEVIAVSQDELGRQGRPVPVPVPPPCPSCWAAVAHASWNDTQCPNLGTPKTASLAGCQAACLQSSGCNAVNFNVAGGGGGGSCVLRGCPAPIQAPGSSAFGGGWSA